VINDTGTPGNNGVWQLVAGESAWSYFSDNLDFIDEDELVEALATEATVRNTAIGTAIAGEVTARNTAITTAVGAEATARGTAISGAIATEVTNRNTAISTAISGISADIEELSDAVSQIDTEVSYETVYA
jgi:hypothetical protein